MIDPLFENPGDRLFDPLIDPRIDPRIGHGRDSRSDSGADGGLGSDDDAFVRLLDSTLRADVSGRRRPRVDVATSVLQSLGFRRMERAALRRRTLRRHGARLLHSAVLLGAAVGGVMANNAAPSAIRADAGIQRAVDRAIDDGLNRPDGARIDQLFRDLNLFDDRLIERARLLPLDEAGPEKSQGDGEDGAGEDDSRATAPYRWV